MSKQRSRGEEIPLESVELPPLDPADLAAAMLDVAEQLAGDPAAQARALDYLAAQAGASPTANAGFKTDQPRDDHGRWGGGGGTTPHVAGAKYGKPFKEANLGSPSDDPKVNAPSPHLPAQSRPELTDSEKKAAYEWSGAKSYQVNRSLRYGKEMSGDTKEMHDNLQSAFAKSAAFPSPVTVHRHAKIGYGSHGNFPTKDDRDKFFDSLHSAASTGSPVTIPGYMATSTTLKASEDYSRGKFETMHMEIVANRGLDVKPYSHFPEMMEFLLNHNSKFKVKSVHHNEENDSYHVKMEQL